MQGAKAESFSHGVGGGNFAPILRQALGHLQLRFAFVEQLFRWPLELHIRAKNLGGGLSNRSKFLILAKKWVEAFDQGICQME